jgi:NADH-quinone oxidoreductase subunit K
VTLQLGHYLALSSVLFTVGAAGFLFRRNALVALMSIELMLNAVNLTLVAANRWQTPTSTDVTAADGTVTAVTSLAPQGHVFAFFVIAVAAAEAAVGLAIVLSFYRLRETVRTDAADSLRG